MTDTRQKRLVLHCFHACTCKDAPMFCSECGAKAIGKFCSSCGTKLRTAEPVAAEEPIVIEPSGDWSQTIDYETLLRYGEVRELIGKAAAQSKASMTGEEFLELCEKALAPFGAGLPWAAIAKFAQPVSTKLGLKTGKERSQVFAVAPGRVLVSILCSLARHGRPLRKATQIENGCVVEADLPSDMFALATGTLTITVRRDTNGTLVEAATHIPGQLIDWGKSSRCLDQLLTEAAAA